jgi:hypothetical protein
MRYEGFLLSHFPLIGNQSRDETLTTPPIGNRMEVFSARVTLDCPLKPTALPPILLFHLIDGKDLIF